MKRIYLFSYHWLIDVFEQCFATGVQPKKKQKRSLPRCSCGANFENVSKCAVSAKRLLSTVLNGFLLFFFCSSSVRASIDSLDRFIENENPYDEVPLESKFSQIQVFI